VADKYANSDAEECLWLCFNSWQAYIISYPLAETKLRCIVHLTGSNESLITILISFQI